MYIPLENEMIYDSFYGAQKGFSPIEVAWPSRFRENCGYQTQQKITINNSKQGSVNIKQKEENLSKKIPVKEEFICPEGRQK